MTSLMLHSDFVVQPELEPKIAQSSSLPACEHRLRRQPLGQGFLERTLSFLAVTLPPVVIKKGRLGSLFKMQRPGPKAALGTLNLEELRVSQREDSGRKTDSAL